ncbi:MAG TPA: 23S rRNA (pseudouridine(1915)-N(3))-methyltransferase RlmH [Bacteroidales bacterium]|nr:23S rRNA (pseudouridine(1915)-N(3))-methyltransferase RlmH [Bacteroidales bacterium]
MKIVLLQTGKTSDKNVSEIAGLYSGRISKYCSFETITLQDIRNTKNMPVEEKKRKEGDKIMQSLNTDDHVVLLDEYGKEYRTIDLAVWLDKLFMLSKKRLVFIIGGPWGFSDEVYRRADQKLSLSRMTFPHQLVRLLFLEQLYRAFTIIKGEPYHHD